MTRIPDAVAVASLDTHRLIVAVPNEGPAEITCNLPRPVAASVLRQLADGLDSPAGRCETALATGRPCPVHDAPATPPTAPAEALLDGQARQLADAIATLGKARGWSTWAADYLHPDREFVDTGAPEEEQPATPAEGDRYIKREAPDAGRVVTVERVWTADDGHTAVTYKWHDPRASHAGSACPLDVFHRTYEAEAHR